MSRWLPVHLHIAPQHFLFLDVYQLAVFNASGLKDSDPSHALGTHPASPAGAEEELSHRAWDHRTLGLARSQRHRGCPLFPRSVKCRHSSNTWSMTWTFVKITELKKLEQTPTLPLLSSVTLNHISFIPNIELRIYKSIFYTVSHTDSSNTP